MLELSLYAAILRLAKKEGVSLSLKARDLIGEALEYYEDVYWARQAEKREKTFSHKKAIKHSKVKTHPN